MKGLEKIVFLMLFCVTPAYALMTPIDYYIANQFDFVKAKTDGRSVWFQLDDSDITIEQGIADGTYVVVSGVKPFVRAKQKGRDITLIQGKPDFLNQDQLDCLQQKINGLNDKLKRLSHRQLLQNKSVAYSFNKDNNLQDFLADETTGHDKALLWSVTPGESLESLLKRWCEKSHYQLFYTGPTYRLMVHAQFDGSFEQAVKTLLISLNQSNLFLNATFYQKNRALVVKERFNEE